MQHGKQDRQRATGRTTPRETIRTNQPRSQAGAYSYAGSRRPVSAKAVGSFIAKLTRPAFEKFGFSAATLITDWETIVGTDFAAYARPERLKWPRRVDYRAERIEDADRGRPGATLILAVEPGRALDVQYKGRQILERINAYFGYCAVADIRIMQIPNFSADPRSPAPVLPPVDKPAKPLSTPAKTEISQVPDDELRRALERMAAGIASRKVRNGAAV
ncbi:MAG: DUF721 domain-containing protein [Hyphomicrobiaceae bacterium]